MREVLREGGVTRTASLFNVAITASRLKHGSLAEAGRRIDKTAWCGECRAGDHAACRGRRIKKYERGYGPCECAANGHGKGGAA
jgi:hypothetical protein